MTNNILIVLASSSPYRRELLARLGVAFEAWSPDVDESSRAGEKPRDTAIRLARAKAEGVEPVKTQDEDYGRFAHIMDLEGRKIELWEPKPLPEQSKS